MEVAHGQTETIYVVNTGNEPQVYTVTYKVAFALMSVGSALSLILGAFV